MTEGSTREPARVPRVGYVVKVYPRYSETFIVNEILAHEAAGLPVEIFALRPARDTHFQDVIARVRAQVTYLGDGASVKAEAFWTAVREAQALPGFRAGLPAAMAASSDEVHAAILQAHAVAARGITHLHAHFATSPATVARMAAAFAGIGYSFTAHAKDIYHESVRPDDLERKLRDAAAAVTVSDYNLEHLRLAFGPAAARLRRIYNGLDLERLAYRPPRDRPPRIVAVGRLVEKKGFDVLVDACARLAAGGRAFTCDIIGMGERERALRDQVARHGLEGRVVLAGPQPQGAVMEAIAGASVLAMPCVVGADGNRDGLPTAILEAMALGTPCVATDVTGIPEAITNGRSGLIVRQRDAGALAAAIDRLLTDAPLRVHLAEGARRRIEADFDIRRNTAIMRKVFSSCALPCAAAAAGA
ncbi:MAG TPA: glycosyltransferase [Vicinamibacterales bacterium]|nr:glycosyltransferase [Vicinamibacterales bacterium]